ncbi:MAG: hypothetical protein L3J83_08415, partial [Proteobacteria bacterium]|nr:hypothetical protein [Pseudomonadota bacterium]
MAGSSGSTSGGSLEYKVKVSKVNEDNIPALKSEEFVTNIENYRSKLILELTAITDPRGGVETFSTSWDKVTKTIYKRPSFGDQLKRTGFFEDDVNAIVSGISDEVSKTFLIFNYVKSKVKWNNFYGYSALKGTKKAYNEGDGSVGDINLLLVAMLRSIGVNASPVLVSTRNHGIPLYPTTKGFNYVICMVESGDGYMLLDATARYSTFNTLPTRALNWQGRVVRANGSSAWINLSSTKVSKESTSMNVKINDDYTIGGKVRKSLTEYVAMSYRNRFANASEEDHIKYLERNNGDIEVSELNFENAKDVTKPLKLTYEYQLSDAVEEIGDKLYFSPLLFLATKENPFKQEERLYPIDFIYPFEDKYTVNVMLPEGYKVESLPESGIFDFNNDAGKFSYVIKENGNFLQIKVDFNINKAIIITTDYKIFKEFYGKMVE